MELPPRLLLTEFVFSSAHCVDATSAALVDADADGITADVDCDDSDPSVGGHEIPYDGIDNDCNANTRDDDLDGDGFVLAEDCDDSDPNAFAHGDPWWGDVTTKDAVDLCHDYCTRQLNGSLYLDVTIDDNVTLTDKAAWALVHEIDDVSGTIVVDGNG